MQGQDSKIYYYKFILGLLVTNYIRKQVQLTYSIICFGLLWLPG